MEDRTKSVSKLLAMTVLVLLLATVANTRTQHSYAGGRHENDNGATRVLSSIRRRLFLMDPKTSVGKPSNTANKDCQMLLCLQTILQNQQLPIGSGPTPPNGQDQQLKVFAHHWDARNVQWNVHSRMAPIPQLNDRSTCSVWEVGANTHARDTEQFLQQYPTCVYHAYEPIPDFFVQLNQHWSQESRVTPHNYGLGPEDTTIQITSSELQGESTYLGDSSMHATNHNSPQGGAGGISSTTTAHIKSFATAVKDAGGQVPTLLHINCEGCEWDMLPAAKQAGFLDDIEVIQFGTHNYGSVGLGNRVWQLCEIRQLLSETHDMAPGGVAFGWERWIKRHSGL